jgi:tricorn protease
MHGLDWKAIRTKYEPLVARAGDRTDVNRIVADMVAELNVGHAYVNDPTPPAPRTPVGYLGADLEPVAGSDAVRIKRILRTDDFELDLLSPLATPGLGVKVGDYIVAINGSPVQRDQDPQALLVATAGQIVTIEVNDKPLRDGARLVRVKPLATELRLRYLDWVRGRREYVKARAGEDFGYLHVPNMANVGLIEFVKGFYPALEKDAIVYDLRGNTGGWISSLLLKSIGTKNYLYWKPRNGMDWARETWWAPVGHAAVLAEEKNFSDGELFLETWRRMKIGPIIGVRTAGGEVGSGGGHSLIDGGSINPPNYGTYADGKWVIEGEGVDPDIWVDQDQAAVLAGRDPQLDRAIEVLQEKLRKQPIKKPVAPPFPKKAGS